MRIVICEGLDGVGKSSLLQLLHELHPEIDIIRMHPDYPQLTSDQLMEMTEDEVATLEAMQQEGTEGFRVYDRCPHPDDWVFKGITDNRPFTDWDVRRHVIDQRMARLGVEFVLLQPGRWADYLDRYRMRGDKWVKIEDLQRISLRYELFIAKTRCKVHRMKADWWTAKEAQELADIVKGVAH